MPKIWNMVAAAFLVAGGIFAASVAMNGPSTPVRTMGLAGFGLVAFAIGGLALWEDVGKHVPGGWRHLLGWRE